MSATQKNKEEKMTRTVLLGDICDIKIGRTPPRKESQWFSATSGQKWASIKDMGNSGKNISITSEYLSDGVVEKFRVPLIKKGTLLLSFKLTVGRLGFAVEDMYSNEAIAQLPVKDISIVDKDWLYYYLKNFNFDSLSSTSSIATAVNSQTVKNIKVELLDINTQKKIANILGTIDEKIELNRRMNETLEQMGQALFRHYFVDNPEAEEWKTGRFEDVSDVLTGKGSTKSQLSESGNIPLYGANGIMGTSEEYLYDEPLVVTGRVGTLGAVRAVTGKAWFSDNVLIMKPKISSFGFIYHTAKGFDYIAMNRGSTQPLVTQTDLKNKPIKIPDDYTLTKFEESFSSIFEVQQANDKQTQTLTTLRDTLLPRLISGKIEV